MVGRSELGGPTPTPTPTCTPTPTPTPNLTPSSTPHQEVEGRRADGGRTEVFTFL